MVERIRKDSRLDGCKGWIMDMVERIYKGSGRTDVMVGIWTWYNGFIKVLVGRMLRWDNRHGRTN